MHEPSPDNEPPPETAERRELIRLLDQSNRVTLLFEVAPEADQPRVLHANPAAIARFPWSQPSATGDHSLPPAIRAAVRNTVAEGWSVVPLPVAFGDSPARFRVETGWVDPQTIALVLDDITADCARRDLTTLWSDLVDDLDDLVVICTITAATTSLDLPVILASEAARPYTRTSSAPTLRDVVGNIFGAWDIRRLDALRAQPGRAQWRAASGHREWRCTARSVSSYLALVLKDVSTQADIVQVLTAQARQLAEAQKDDAITRDVLTRLTHDLLRRQARHARALGAALDAADLDAARREQAASTAVAEQVSALIEGLATFTAIDEHVRTSGPVDLDAILLQILDEESPRAAAADATFDRRPLPVIWGDEAQVRLLLRHLIHNALAAGRPGVPLLIRIAAAPSDGYWRLTIDDNGIGIPPDDREQVFEPLYQVSGHSRRGPGLGLAICRRIARTHSGDIGCSPVSGPGCRMWVDFPMR